MSKDRDPFARHSLRTSIFFPQSRLHIAGNPKAAGTSLRWWLLPLHGVPVKELTRRSLWGESAPFQTVWDPSLELTYTWHNLTAAQREDALTASDVLTVHPVRNPITRAFSAWSGKVLNHESYYSDRFPDWFPQLPEKIQSVDEIRAQFEQFVLAAQQLVESSGWPAIDVHFWPQHQLLGWQAPGEVLVLRQEAMRAGLDRIVDHLAAFGICAGPTPRFNETIVGYQEQLISPKALEAVTALYDRDFSRWDYAKQAPPTSSTPVDFDWLNDVRGRNRRYQTLHEAVTAGLAREQQLTHDLDRARGQEQALLGSTSWRVTRPLRWVSRTAGRARRHHS